MSVTIGLPFSAQRAAEWAHAMLIGNGTLMIEHVVIDSREADDNVLFVALPGTHTHGNNYVRSFLDSSSLESSSRCVLVERSFYHAHKQSIEQYIDSNTVAIIAVDKPLYALGAIARTYLRQFDDQTVVAITGSVGKTTTKSMVANILQQLAPTCESKGNYNSDIGAALSALRAKATDKFLVFEAGTGYPGELAYISSIINPHHVLITTIGTAHIEFFGSKLAIAAEKLSLATASDNLVSLFISQSDTYPAQPLSTLKDKIRYYDAVAKIDSYSQANRLFLSLAERTIELPFIGDFHHGNILAAVALCRSLGADDTHIAQGCVSLQPPHNRFEYIKGDIYIISDCYNASPESYAAALTYIDSMSWSGKKYAVIGSMLELGSFSNDCHTQLINTVLHSSIDYAWCIGVEFEHIDFNQLPTIVHNSDIDDVAGQLQTRVQQGDLVFIKGSRAHALERLLAPLAAPQVAIAPMSANAPKSVSTPITATPTHYGTDIT